MARQSLLYAILSFPQLRQENQRLKRDLGKIVKSADMSASEQSVTTTGPGQAIDKPDSPESGLPSAASGPLSTASGPVTKSGPPSLIEFVTSPDDEIVYKLTAQLELVERQRRQVRNGSCFLP